jgi:exodeoxyribonuclease VII small subunit
MPNDEKESGEPSYEEAMGRLEKIVSEMETANLPLEQLLGRYEEGIRLVGICQQLLTGAENRIETLTRQASSKPPATAKNPAPAAPAGRIAPKDLTTIQNEEIRLF